MRVWRGNRDFIMSVSFMEVLKQVLIFFNSSQSQYWL